MNYKNIVAPASKSYLQRALAISALVKGQTILTNSTWCNDSIAAKQIIEKLGSVVTEENGELNISSDKLSFNNTIFFAGESGLSIRMFSPILALSHKEIIFTGNGSLLKRPINIITDALTKLDVKTETNKNFLPLKITGPIKPNNIEIDGSLSSQLLTGLLITLPIINGNSQINVSNLKSTPYIDMTVSIMNKFGVEVENIAYNTYKIKGNQSYRPTTYNIEGDWSNAAFFLVLGAVNGKIEVENLNTNSVQADKKIITALKKAGAKITIKDTSVIVEKAYLNAFEFDATNCPDLFPPIACLATQCNGTSVIKGVSRLKYKESDRATVLKNELTKLGIKVTIENDYMQITGGKLLPNSIDSNNDHRIAMMGGILNMFCDSEITIKNKNAVNKSYPNFFKDLNTL